MYNKIRYISGSPVEYGYLITGNGEPVLTDLDGNILSLNECGYVCITVEVPTWANNI
jgi:hypothetical protein